MAQTSTHKNTLLMVAPVAVLGALGLLLQNREPAVFTVPAPFRVFIKKVRLVPIKPSEVQDGYDTKVEIELGAKGRATWWWQKGFNGYSSEYEGQIIAANQGSSHLMGVPWHARPHLETTDAGSSRWVAYYLLKLVPIPANAGDIHLRHRLQVENSNTKYGAPVWLDTVIRRNGQETLPPQVSHDPRLVLESWNLDQRPPVENLSESYRWRLSLRFRKKGPLSDSPGYGLNENLNVRDATGDTSPMWGNSMSLRQPGERSGSSRSYDRKNPDPRLTYVLHDFSDLGSNDVLTKTYATPKAPVWIEGEANWNDNWPLWVKIPLRDSKGRALLSPRPAPTFRVLSILVRSASTDEKSNWGADTTVQVTLEATNLRADVSKWDWQGHFSQHLQDAKGRNHWTFPFTGNSTRQATFPEYETSLPGRLATISYPLILTSISKSAGALTFHAQISANGSRRVPVSVEVRPASLASSGK